MMRKTRLILGLACSAFLCGAAISAPAMADVKLGGMFGDHMVLQSGVPIPINGKATPGETVTVTIGSHTATAKADEHGKFRAMLDALQSTNEPQTLTAAGSSTITVKDVLIGEVWLASGQSNMGYGLKATINGPDEMAKAEHPQLRLCVVGNSPSLEPIEDRGCKWQLCTPETAKGFSAVAYFFGRDLQAALNRPVGMIGSYVAGTPGQSWTPEEGFKTSPGLEHYARDLEAARNKSKDPTTKPGKVEAGVPSSLYNGMISPVKSYTIKGALWYQGESNTGEFAEYRELLPALINGWRKEFNQGDFPFLIVQLPGNQDRTANTATSNWAMLREAQASALKLPNTGMVVTIDTVPARAILHPKNKADIGARLALVAREKVYGEKIESSGPTYQSMSVEGSTLRLKFTHAEGLKIAAPPEEGKGDSQPPKEIKGFSIAGSDQKFYLATAKIDRSDIVVQNSEVKMPVAVRYAFANNPEVDLYNSANLPMAPFRTDDWPVERDGK